MALVKICGLRREEDILYANDLKVDYVGFVFANSKRQVTLEIAKGLVNRLDKDIKKVGVFVNEDVGRINEVCKNLSLDVIQLHGDEPPDVIGMFDLEVWKAIRVRDRKDIEKAKGYKSQGVLLDTYVEGTYGGTGKMMDLEVLKDINIDAKVILAGGLNVKNVGLGIDKVKPYIVDVSSGVETDGYKDYEKMKEFVRRVREHG